MHDMLKTEMQATESNRFAAMPDTELLMAFEFCRIGCGIHEGKLPGERTMRKFWQIWCELRLREKKRCKCND
jgi:hypothetical protein